MIPALVRRTRALFRGTPVRDRGHGREARGVGRARAWRMGRSARPIPGHATARLVLVVGSVPHDAKARIIDHRALGTPSRAPEAPTPRGAPTPPERRPVTDNRRLDAIWPRLGTPDAAPAAAGAGHGVDASFLAGRGDNPYARVGHGIGSSVVRQRPRCSQPARKPPLSSIGRRTSGPSRAARRVSWACTRTLSPGEEEERR